MGNICECTLGKRNTAPNSCPDLMQIAARIILVPKFSAAGVRNEFATVAATTKAALQAKFDASDIDDRYFPVMEFKNVEDTQADSTFEEFTDKSKVKIEDGKRSFTGYIVNQGTKYLEKLASWGCQLEGFGVYIIDKNKNFVYITDSATKLKVRPIEIDANSFEAKLIKATDTTVEKIKISFDFHQTMEDKYLRYIAFEDLDFDGLDTADVYGLYDITATTSGMLTTACTLTITTDYGLAVKGLLITNFYDAIGGSNSKLYNLTDAAAVTILTFSETADGVYAMTFAAQTPADVLRATIVKSKYDTVGLSAVTITIP